MSTPRLGMASADLREHSPWSDYVDRPSVWTDFR